MTHRNNRDTNIEHAADFSGVYSTAIHNDFALDVTVVG